MIWSVYASSRTSHVHLVKNNNNRTGFAPSVAYVLAAGNQWKYHGRKTFRALS